MMGNILVIDDSPTVCKVIEVSLLFEGYEVVCCQSGDKALSWLSSSEARVPDLILVDLGLPGMDGYSVIQCLRSRLIFKSTPIIIISRFDGILHKLKGRLVGANDYIVKPFKTEYLVSVVHNHLRGSLVGAVS
jgi:twitching motility two-component system response regulator PilG